MAKPPGFGECLLSILSRALIEQILPQAGARVQGPTESQAQAAAHFRLGQYLFDQGHTEDAQKAFAEARRLRPESWNYIRQSLELEEVGKASGPEFFAQVQALGDKSYYPPVRL